MPARKNTPAARPAASKSTAKPAARPAASKAPSPRAAKAGVPEKRLPKDTAGSPAKAAKPAEASAAPKKPKLVRDSFTMPKSDFDLIDQLKARAMGFGRHVKKSELLRAGLQALSRLDDAALQAVLAALPQLKPGRPGKQG